MTPRLSAPFFASVQRNEHFSVWTLQQGTTAGLKDAMKNIWLTVFAGSKLIYFLLVQLSFILHVVFFFLLSPFAICALHLKFAHASAFLVSEKNDPEERDFIVVKDS